MDVDTVAKKPAKDKDGNTPWTKQELITLRMGMKLDYSYEQMGLMLGKSYSAVAGKIFRLREAAEGITK